MLFRSSKCVCENDSMSSVEICSSNEFLELFKSKKHTSTPMSSSARLSCDAAGVELDPTLYRSMIGSLLYLIASRPNITFSVGVHARF